jgi:hypothetical protein
MIQIFFILLILVFIKYFSSKSKLSWFCDRRSVGQFVLVSGPIWVLWPDFNILCLTITFFLLHVGRPLWREDRFIICRAITHWLESHKTHNHILLSHLRLSQPGGPGSRIYIPQERGFSVIPPDTGFPFHRLLQFAGYGGGILTRLHAGLSKSTVFWDIR